MDSAKRVASGTFGSVWLNGNKLSECYGLQVKRSSNKEKINMAGQMAEDTKVTSTSGTGSLKLYKVDSRMLLEVGKALERGEDVRFTVLSELDDPDTYGAERIAVYDVSFDDLTLVDWERAAVSKVECPFTWTRSELLDAITPR